MGGALSFFYGDKLEAFKLSLTNLIIRQTTGCIPVEMSERIEGNFRNLLHQCIENGGYNLEDILLKTA